MKDISDTSQWNDLFVRTSPSETGPTGRVGGLSSPDIIPWGITPTDPYRFTTQDSYRNYMSSQGLRQRMPNYIYVRARNSAPNTPAVGSAYLALTDPALVLWPGGEGWTSIKTNNGNAYSSLQPSPVAGNAIAVTTDPFVYIPEESGHRCIVTWLSTQSHPVAGAPPKITDMSMLVQFLQDNPNYAHHNVDIAPSTTGAVTNQKPFSSGTGGFSWICGLQVTNCKGFRVSFSSSAPLPDGSHIIFEPTDVMQNETIRYMLGPFDLPPNWETNMNYTYETNGLDPANFAVTFIAQYSVGSRTHPDLWDLAEPLSGVVGIDEDTQRDVRVITVGSIGVMKGSVPL
jgi:hypothetical protein